MAFGAFRSRLAAAVESRDFEQLEPLLDPRIKVDFGGGEGLADFVATWRQTDWRSSPLWDELGAAIALGCGDGDGYYAMPSMFTAIIPDADLYEAKIALGEAVEMYERPDRQSQLLATLDWALVTVVDPAIQQNPEPGWTKITASDGTTGYVREDELRSPIDYRAVFKETENGWRMAAFVAGD